MNLRGLLLRERKERKRGRGEKRKGNAGEGPPPCVGMGPPEWLIRPCPAAML